MRVSAGSGKRIEQIAFRSVALCGPEVEEEEKENSKGELISAGRWKEEFSGEME